MPKYILSLIEIAIGYCTRTTCSYSIEICNENVLSLLCATGCPVFEIKAKINVSVPSCVINLPNSTDFYIKRFLLLVHSVTRTSFDDGTKNHTSYTWLSWSNMQMLYFSIVLWLTSYRKTVINNYSVLFICHIVKYCYLFVFIVKTKMQMVFLWYSCSANSILVPLIVMSLLQIVMSLLQIVMSLLLIVMSLLLIVMSLLQIVMSLLQIVMSLLQIVMSLLLIYLNTHCSNKDWNKFSPPNTLE